MNDNENSFGENEARECILTLKAEIAGYKKNIEVAVGLIYNLVTEFHLQDMLEEE